MVLFDIILKLKFNLRCLVWSRHLIYGRNEFEYLHKIIEISRNIFTSLMFSCLKFESLLMSDGDQVQPALSSLDSQILCLKLRTAPTAEADSNSRVAATAENSISKQRRKRKSKQKWIFLKEMIIPKVFLKFSETF